MNKTTKTYYLALLISVIVFSIAKYTTNKLNDKIIVIPIDSKPIIPIKQEPLNSIVKKTNNIIKIKLQCGGDWRSR